MVKKYLCGFGLAVISSFAVTKFIDITHEFPLAAQCGIFGSALIFIFLLYVLVLSIWNGWFKAKINMWRIGKLRGLWSERGLVKELKCLFLKSDSIKIKVTRGSELLEDSNLYGIKSYLQSLSNGRKKESSAVDISILLVIPCFKLEHVRERYERHHTDLSEEEFLETWYDFIKQIRLINSSFLKCNIRFYFEEHARWRFYIFSGHGTSKSRIFLSEYDRNASGSSQPMYKIIKGERNIGTFMEDYFDEIWEKSITPLELYETIKEGQCLNLLCFKAPGEIVELASQKYQQCPYFKSCQRFCQNYANYLQSFNTKTRGAKK